MSHLIVDVLNLPTIQIGCVSIDGIFLTSKSNMKTYFTRTIDVNTCNLLDLFISMTRTHKDFFFAKIDLRSVLWFHCMIK